MAKIELYDAIFEDDSFVNGKHKIIKVPIKLTRKEKENHDKLLNNLEIALREARLQDEILFRFEKEWENLEKNDSYFSQRDHLIKENTEKGEILNYEYSELRMFENYLLHYEPEDHTTEMELEAGEEEMRKWDEEDPSWRVANDLD